MSHWTGSSRAVALVVLLALGSPAQGVSVRAAASAAQRPEQAPSLPERISDDDFWKLVSEISEPGGYFQITDNYTSNENELGQVFSMLRGRGVRGGVYLGVGPEQNFSYIAAIRPVMAFIVDIRRQAVMQHLMYKAMFELAKDRADFISLLFSMRRPDGLDETTSIQDIFGAFDQMPTDWVNVPKNATRVTEHLTKGHGFTFTAEEMEQLDSVMKAFVRYGPDISTRGAPRGRMPGNGVTFSDLNSWSLDASGEPQSFLSTEEHFRIVKALHEKNLIVPVSGDFAGPRAVRAIGTYVQKHGGTVTAFYVSNVEQYLFQDNKQSAFYLNVAALPVDETSVFVRPYSLRRSGTMAQALCAIGGFLGAVSAGKVETNNDALACAR